MTEICGKWYMENLLRYYHHLGDRNKVKNHNRKMMKLRKLSESNRRWNDQKFQLYWNKLEWVNPRIKNKRKQPYSVSSNIFY